MHEIPDLEAMRTFVVIAASGSFASAASILGRDPTVLSRRLKALEAKLGVRLANRTTRAFVLTEAGRAYLGRIKPLLEELGTAGGEAATFVTGSPRGRLRVALPGSFARLWLNPLIVSFMRAHPEITLDAKYSNAFVDLVGEGFDLAVRIGAMTDSRLVARKIGTRRRLVCASPHYLSRSTRLQRPEDIADHACLCFTGLAEPYRWDFVDEHANRTSAAANCYMASDDADLLVAAVRAGLGLFYTTDWHVGPYLASGELVEVLEQHPVAGEGAIYVLTPAASGTPSKTRAFSDWLAARLTPHPWLAGLDEETSRQPLPALAAGQ